MTDDPDDSTIRVGRRNRDDDAVADESTVRVARPARRGEPLDPAAIPPTPPVSSPSLREITPHAREGGVISRVPGDLGGTADAVAAARSRDVDGAAIERAVQRIARIRALTVLGIAIAVVAASVVLLVLLLA